MARGSGTATRGRKWGRGRGNGTFIRVGVGCDCGGTISASSIGPAGGSDVILLAKDAGESDQARSSLSPSRAAGRISNGHLVSITPRSRCTTRDQSDGQTEASSAVAKSAKMLATMTVVRLPCILATLCSKLLSTQISQLARSGLIPPPHQTHRPAAVEESSWTILRNGRGNTAIGAYSPRARPKFPIACPVTWSQVEAGFRRMPSRSKAHFGT